MSKIEALIEEIKSDFSRYSDNGLIDEDSLYRDVRLALKKFGNDVTILDETMVDLVGGKAELPLNFLNLSYAYLCEPDFYTKNEFHSLQTSHFYKEKVVHSESWNECEDCCRDITENSIREDIYFKGSEVSLYYKNPQLLTLSKTMKKEFCAKKCRNKLVQDNPNEINIYERMLTANFNEGSVYVQYYGYPVDEEGNIDLPEDKNGHLEIYLEYFLKRRLTERLMANNDAVALSNLYNVFAGQERTNLVNARGSLKMSNINPVDFRNRMKTAINREVRKYESKLTW